MKPLFYFQATGSATCNWTKKTKKTNKIAALLAARDIVGLRRFVFSDWPSFEEELKAFDVFDRLLTDELFDWWSRTYDRPQNLKLLRTAFVEFKKSGKFRYYGWICKVRGVFFRRLEEEAAVLRESSQKERERRVRVSVFFLMYGHESDCDVRKLDELAAQVELLSDDSLDAKLIFLYQTFKDVESAFISSMPEEYGMINAYINGSPLPESYNEKELLESRLASLGGDSREVLSHYRNFIGDGEAVALR